MDLDHLFSQLDVDNDGALTQSDLSAAARHLGWHWQHAPLFAVLDLMTIGGPLDRSTFTSLIHRILKDPRGPYGEVLSLARQPGRTPPGPPATRTALLVIDPQRSFTRGAWMRSIGTPEMAKRQVEPIREAFENCAQMLRQLGDRVEVMFTRCPFPPDSYDWDEPFDGVIDTDQVYFIKPGNSVLWPETNGFQGWIDGLLEGGLRTLTMAGCTLNSCVRVSSIETHRLYRTRGLEVVVDLSLCGARAANYTPTPTFQGKSSVQAAVVEMKKAGVKVVDQVDWP